MIFGLSLCTETCHITFIGTLFKYWGVLIMHIPGERGISHHCSPSIKGFVFHCFNTLLEFSSTANTSADFCHSDHSRIPLQYSATGFYQALGLRSSCQQANVPQPGLMYALDTEAGWSRLISIVLCPSPKVNRWVCSSLGVCWVAKLLI